MGNFRFLFTVRVTSYFEYFFYFDKPTFKYLQVKHHLGDLNAHESAIRNGSQSNWIGGYGLNSAGLGRVVVVGCLECQNDPLGSGNSREFRDELGNSQLINDSIQHHYVSWRDLRLPPRRKRDLLSFGILRGLEW